jgi:hypothetical protein
MGSKNNGGKISESDVVSRETFSDGSQVVELRNGTLLLLESRTANVLNFAEQPAPYDQPPPKPKPR